MFTMMNSSRLGVSVQGMALSTCAYQQQAWDYARERQQGHLPGKTTPCSIIQHADVRRVLLSMSSQVEAQRALTLYTAPHKPSVMLCRKKQRYIKLSHNS